MNFEEVQKFRIVNKLKSTYRLNSVEKRKESSAEHTWSCLMLADLLFAECDLGADKTRVKEILQYHDLVELKVGDTPLHPDVSRDGVKKREEVGAKELAAQLPTKMQELFLSAFDEYTQRKTREGKLAKAINDLDADIHELDYKGDWAGWSEEFLREHKESLFVEFPELMKLFEDILEFLKSEDYFS